MTGSRESVTEKEVGIGVENCDEFAQGGREGVWKVGAGVKELVCKE